MFPARKQKKRDKIRRKLMKNIARSKIEISPSTDIVDYQTDNTDPIAEFDVTEEAVTQCFLHEHFVIVSSNDCNVYLYDVTREKVRLKMTAHGPIDCFVFLPSENGEGGLLLLGTKDGQVPGWEVTFTPKLSANLTVVIPMHLPNPIRVMTSSPSRNRLATGCCFLMTQVSLWRELEGVVRGTLKLWDLKSITEYARDPQNYRGNVAQLRMRTGKQLVARKTMRHSRNQLRFESSKAEADQTEVGLYGVCAVAFTADETKLLVGLGHPTEAEVKDRKMLIVVDEKTFETLWILSDVRNVICFSFYIV